MLPATPSVPKPAACGSEHIHSAVVNTHKPQRLPTLPGHAGVETWWRNGFSGTLQESPRFSVRARIQGHPSLDAEGEAASLVTVEAVREMIKADVIPALGGELCSLGVSVSRLPASAWEIVAEGLDASLIPQLLSQVAVAFRQQLGTRPQGLLRAWKRRALSRIADRSDEMAFDVASEAASELAMIGSWTRADLSEALQHDPFDFSRSDAAPFKGAVLYLVAPGLSKEGAQAAGLAMAEGLHTVDGGAVAQPTSAAYTPEVQGVARIGSAEVAIANPISNDISSAVVMSHLMTASGIEQETSVQLLARVLDDHFSRGLRFATEDAAETAGYIVACNFRRPTPGVMELRFIAQGTKPSSELRRLLITALAGASEVVERLTSKGHEEELHTWTNSLITSLSAPPTDLGEAADRDWGEVWTLRQCFGRRERAISFLRWRSSSWAESLRSMWATIVAADTAIVEVFAVGKSHMPSSLVVPLRRKQLEQQLWLGRESFPAATPCSSSAGSAATAFSQGEQPMAWCALLIVTLFAVICATWFRCSPEARRSKDA